METILWAFVLLMLGIQSILLIAVCVFLLRELKGIQKELPKLELNPVKAVKEYKAQKEAKMERDKIETILANIENYDGTGNNQEDVPGR